MSDYHPYVFDAEGRRFVGQFEEMYRAEQEEGFDSWYQDDLRFPDKQFCLALLAGYCFNRVLDVGCGKGAITQFLKKQNNQVVALDLSETALRVARVRYPDIQFLQADVREADFDLTRVAGMFDLVVCMEMLSYVANWRSLLAQFSRTARYALVALDLPQDPIGFVKSLDELLAEFAAHFTIVEDVRLVARHIYILFGESKEFA